MFEWIGKRSGNNVRVDIHSHLLPGIDDGVKTWEESLSVLMHMADLGFEKIITTPHIHSAYYLNTASHIRELEREWIRRVEEAHIPVKISCAAEYMVDEHFMHLLEQPEALLSFGNEQYVLIESGFHYKSLYLEEALFELARSGYQPILAHPERYDYMDEFFAQELQQRNVKMQVSFMSLEGYYGNAVRKRANKLLKAGCVAFLGSDLHRVSQMEVFKRSLKHRAFSDRFLNNELL